MGVVPALVADGCAALSAVGLPSRLSVRLPHETEATHYSPLVAFEQPFHCYYQAGAGTLCYELVVARYHYW